MANYVYSMYYALNRNGKTRFTESTKYFIIYYYKNKNGVLKMTNKSSKNKNKGLVYMVNE